jgi:hypothetical protein
MAGVLLTETILAEGSQLSFSMAGVTMSPLSVVGERVKDFSVMEVMRGSDLKVMNCGRPFSTIVMIGKFSCCGQKCGEFLGEELDAELEVVK